MIWTLILSIEEKIEKLKKDIAEVDSTMTVDFNKEKNEVGLKFENHSTTLKWIPNPSLFILTLNDNSFIGTPVAYDAFKDSVENPVEKGKKIHDIVCKFIESNK